MGGLIPYVWDRVICIFCNSPPHSLTFSLSVCLKWITSQIAISGILLETQRETQTAEKCNYLNCCERSEQQHISDRLPVVSLAMPCGLANARPASFGCVWVVCTYVRMCLYSSLAFMFRGGHMAWSDDVANTQSETGIQRMTVCQISQNIDSLRKIYDVVRRLASKQVQRGDR